jgi:hypothetical protein
VEHRYSQRGDGSQRKRQRVSAEAEAGEEPHQEPEGDDDQRKAEKAHARGMGTAGVSNGTRNGILVVPI